MNTIQGDLTGKNIKIGIVIPRFNDFITSKLLDGCIDGLLRHSVSEKNIDIYKVPGAFEIPVTAQKISGLKKYNALICLGAVIRGDTPHFDYVANEMSKGIANVSMQNKIPIVFAVLTTDTLEQAIDRAGAKSGNKGFEAAMTAIEMVNLFNNIK